MSTAADDELAIRSLAAAYADAVNRRDAEGMAAVLAPDGIIEKPGMATLCRDETRYSSATSACSGNAVSCVR